MDVAPSIRSTYVPGQGVQYSPTKSATHEALRHLVNDCLQGLRIYQPFQGDKALTPLSRGLFFVRIHRNPVETGFLVFAPRHVPIFIHESLARSFIVRMRLSTAMHENTAILAVTLDKSDGYLWLEDVLAWHGQNIHATQTFTERRRILRQFAEHDWMPDARASGGLTLRIAPFHSLEEFVKEHADPTEWWAVDLCPDMADRRRFRVRSAGGVSGTLVGEVRPVTGLPDVYEIWSSEEQCVGRATIQELSLSKEVRTRFGREKLFAEVEWKAQFGKFRIKTLVSSATARSTTAAFLAAGAAAAGAEKSEPEVEEP